MKDNDNELLSFIDENNKQNKRKKKKRKQITIFLINLLTITLLVGGGFGIKIILDQKRDYEDIDRLQTDIAKFYSDFNNTIPNEEIIEEEIKEETTSIFDELLVKNKDTVGWLKVNNTRIDLPVVQSKDNKYYLNHDFNKKYNSMGWVFGDYRNDFKELDQNNIIYGHTYKDTIMLSSLQYVLDKQWQNNETNHIIEFNTIEQNLKWQIFSIYTIPETSDYLKVTFDNNEFIEFTDMLKKRSIKKFDVDFNVDDKIITLSTCYINSDNRLVVHAKLIK